MAETTAAEIVTFRLVNRKATNWVMEGTEKDPEPRVMDFPSTYNIIPNSKIKKADGSKGLVEIRHILGQESIWPKEHKENGATIDKLMDIIWFTNGSLTIVREGGAIGTFDYLKNYQGNGHNPLRPDDAEVEYEEVRDSEIAAEKVTDGMAQLDAMLVLQGLRIPDATVEGKHTFDVPALTDMARLFNVDTESTPVEMFWALMEIAKTNPEHIVNTASNPKKKIVLDIKKAQDLALIVFDPERVYYAATKAVIMGFKGRASLPERVKELSEFLSRSVNKDSLDHLRLQISAQEEKLLDTGK